MRSPLTPREGISATRLRAPGGAQTSAKAHLPVPASVGEWLAGEFPHSTPEERAYLAGRPDGGCLTCEDGTPVGLDDPVRPGAFYFFHRPVPPEDPIPFAPTVLYADRDIVIVDKPHFLASTPNGRFVRESAVTRLRVELDEPDIVAVHRLDRATAGLLMLSRRPETRGAYQVLFQNRSVRKTYRALAWLPPGLRTEDVPSVRRSRLHKEAGERQVREIPGEPNSETRIRIVSQRPVAAESAAVRGAGGAVGEFELMPVTGKTHQLRVHMNGLGMPLVGDPLYPVDQARDPYDFSDPLQLVAARLEFADPLTGRPRCFESQCALRWPAGVEGGPA